MTSVIQSPYTEEQIAGWLRGLLTVAWADGHYDPEEQEVLDGLYSQSESDVLHQFCKALGHQVEALEALQLTLYNGQASQSISSAQELVQKPGMSPHPHSDILLPVREWLNAMDIQDPRVARFVCKMIPAQCPFERDVVLFGRKIIHIPPMCKLNPLYEQLVGLRFRALSYLADERGEDISPYC